MSTTSSVAHVPLSRQIREDTREVHEEAEHTPFIQDLLGGRLGLEGYARLVVQHRAIYTELEAVVAESVDPVLAPFLSGELARLDAIEEDLKWLQSADVLLDATVLPATHRYCQHLATVCRERPAALLAHHYVRYLGDLSGGMIVARVLRRHLELPEEAGTAFYTFAGIESPRAFKMHYRAMLDELPWDGAQRVELVAEVQAAYRFNADVLYALGGDPVVPAPARRGEEKVG